MKARRSKPRSYRPMADINVTPMVDVMLVLLVIFIMAAPLLTRSVKVDLPPERAGNGSVEHKPVTLSIDAAGQMFIDKKAVNEAELDQALRSLAQQDPLTQVQINADQSVAYAKVAHILAAAQAAGLSKVGFVMKAAGP
ncbi:MAG: ExbD/TolR family protein [Formosimonas sp.]